MNLEDKKAKFFERRIFASILLVSVLSIFIFAMNVQAEDKKPTAVIDGTLEVSQGHIVYLDGSFSSAGSEDATSLDYQWTLLSTPEGSLALLDPSGPEVSFRADVIGTYKVKLVVSDGMTDSDPAYAEIIVK